MFKYEIGINVLWIKKSNLNIHNVEVDFLTNLVAH